MRVLIFRPPYRGGEIYFRAQQVQHLLEQTGHEVEVVAGGGKAGYAWALLRWPVLLLRAQLVFLYPHPPLCFYVLTASWLKRKVVIDHFVSYVRFREVRPWGILLVPFERWAYRRATFILAHTATVAEQISAAWNVRASVHTLYCVVDTQHFAPRYHAAARRLRARLGLNGKFVVFYHGMWHPWHGVPVLREAIRLLAEAGEQVTLVLLGRSGNGPPHERWLDSVKYLDLPSYIQLADVWCSGYVNHPRGDRSFSSTMIQAFAMARPVITSPSPEKSRYPADQVSVLFVPPQDPAALSQAIQNCMRDRGKCRAIGRAGRRVAVHHFDEQHLAAFLNLACRA